MRPRSALGLKYIELTPGTSKATWKPAPRSRSSRRPSRSSSRTCSPRSTARRGRDPGRHRGLRQRLRRPRPVASTARSRRSTRSSAPHAGDAESLRRRTPSSTSSSSSSARAAAQVAPVARTQAELFTNMADTFAAISRDPRGAAADDREDAAHAGRLDRLLPRPASLPRRLRRPVRAACGPRRRSCPRSLPAINRASGSARRCCRAPSELNERLEAALGEARGPVREPEHAAGAARPRTALTVTPPGARVHRALPDGLQLLELLLHPLGEDQSVVQDGPTGGGTVAEPEPQGGQLAASRTTTALERELAALGHPRGPGPAGRHRRARAARCSASTRRPTSRRSTRRATPTARTARTATRTARSARCATGAATSRTAPTREGMPFPGEIGTGAQRRDHRQNNLPGLSGGTYKSRELGIDNLADVP